MRALLQSLLPPQSPPCRWLPSPPTSHHQSWTWLSSHCSRVFLLFILEFEFWERLLEHSAVKEIVGLGHWCCYPWLSMSLPLLGDCSIAGGKSKCVLIGENHGKEIIKGGLVRKLPSYGRLSWSAFSPSCHPHHHVNRPSSSSWEVKQFGRVWIHRWRHYYASGKVASMVPEGGLCFCGFRARSAKAADKAHRTV